MAAVILLPADGPEAVRGSGRGLRVSTDMYGPCWEERKEGMVCVGKLPAPPPLIALICLLRCWVHARLAYLTKPSTP